MRVQEIVYKIISQFWKEEKKESSRSSLSFPCLPARLLISCIDRILRSWKLSNGENSVPSPMKTQYDTLTANLVPSLRGCRGPRQPLKSGMLHLKVVWVDRASPRLSFSLEKTSQRLTGHLPAYWQ